MEMLFYFSNCVAPLPQSGQYCESCCTYSGILLAYLKRMCLCLSETSLQEQKYLGVCSTTLDLSAMVCIYFMNMK
jgi:hypothetical protein